MTAPVTRPIPTVRQLQAELGLSFGYAAIARRLLIVDDPRIAEAMLAKRITLAQADQIAKLPHEARAEALANPQAIKNAQAYSDELPRLRARVAELEAEVRRLGEMIAAQKETVGLNTGARMQGGDDAGRPVVVTDDRREKPTLADAGISRHTTGCRASHGSRPAPSLEGINPTSLDSTSHQLPGGRR